MTPGGDHRSVQHDPSAQAAALAWLREAIAMKEVVAPGVELGLADLAAARWAAARRAFGSASWSG